MSVFSHKIKFFFAIQEVHSRSTCAQQTCLHMLFLLYHLQNPYHVCYKKTALLVMVASVPEHTNWCMCPPQLESVRWEAQTLKRSGLFYLKTYLIYTFLSRSAAFNRESFTVSSFLVYKFNESLNLLNVAREGLLDDRKLAGMRCVISLICLPTFTTHPSVYHFSGEFSQHQLSRGF